MAEQLGLPLAIDKAALADFLTRWCRFEDEEDALREAKRLLKEEYAADLPLRGVLTAVKIVRATRKLEAHPKESMSRGYLTQLEVLVDEHLEVRSVTQAVQG